MAFTTKKCALAVLALIGALPLASLCQSAQPSQADELSVLRKENAALRSENQRLRRMLAQPENSTKSAGSPTPVKIDSPKPSGTGTTGATSSSGNTDATPETGYWLSRTGKRHNSHCRYYKTTAGRPCGPDEGVPCKICGG